MEIDMMCYLTQEKADTHMGVGDQCLKGRLSWAKNRHQFPEEDKTWSE